MGLRNEGLPGDFTRTVSTNPVSFCLSLTSVSFLHESERLGSFYGEKPIAGIWETSETGLVPNSEKMAGQESKQNFGALPHQRV